MRGPMAIKEQIPLGLATGAIVATMLFGTCRTERATERQYAGLNQQIEGVGQRIDEQIDGVNQRIDDKFSSLAQQMQQGFAEVHRRIDDTNERIDDTHRRLDDLQAQIGDVRNDVRELRSIHLGTADAEPGVD